MTKRRHAPSSPRALQRRLEKYAAQGPNCAKGHPWVNHAKFTYKGYRFCDACTREKAEVRRSRDFSVGAIYAKAPKLGLIERRVRIIIPRPAKLPPLTTALHFPTGSLLDRLNAIVPRYLARYHRDETIAEMYLAIAEGRLDEKDIQRRVREFVNLVDRRDHRSVSLDTAIPGTDLLRINTISEGAWA